jgi:hypothetical protein
MKLQRGFAFPAKFACQISLTLTMSRNKRENLKSQGGRHARAQDRLAPGMAGGPQAADGP